MNIDTTAVKDIIKVVARKYPAGNDGDEACLEITQLIEAYEETLGRQMARAYGNK